MKDNRPTSEEINRIKAGDKQAFKKIYEYYFPLIVRFAKTILLNEEEAQDIVSEAFVKVWECRNKLKEEGNLKSLLYVITRNACFDLLRRKQRNSLSEAEIIYLSYQSSYAEDSMLIDRKIIENEVIYAVYYQIDKLPTRQKLVFKMIFFHGEKVSKIAKLLGIRQQTVLNLKRNALINLKSTLLCK